MCEAPEYPPKAPVFEMIQKYKTKIISEIELAYREAKAPFIAITGTNGKTTTTKLVSEILKKAGYKAPECGNIGTPPTSLLEEDVDFFVSEVSSYQIQTSETFKPYIGCFINYTPDHLDWHGSEKEYFDAKAKLFKGVMTPEKAVLNACDSKIANLSKNVDADSYFFGDEKTSNACYLKDDVIFYKKNNNVEEVIKTSEMKLFGDHNYQNVMVGIIVAKIIGVSTDIIKEVISDFIAPEHRLEYVDSIGNIKFYNDSKATNCDSAICALKAFKDENVVLIAGGKDKGTDLVDFSNTVKEHTSAVILIGEAKERFYESLANAGVKNLVFADSIEHAVDKGLELNKGSVLLSPACASFDMYKNFEERGLAFKDYVKSKINR